MKRAWRDSLTLGVAAGLLAMGSIVGCELTGDDGGGGASGSSAVSGNVVAFETAGATHRAGPVQHEPLIADWFRGLGELLVPSAAAEPPHATGGAGGIVVSLTGPDDRSAATAADGTFSISGLAAGTYGLTFERDGQVVRYRGRSGQTVTITVGTDETVQLINIRISGGHANIGKVHTVRHPPDSPES